ncbi:unnamed protein product [Chrysodeixis includens]|uniref:Uncharacterized protein n=1 Tax=Chrysodeixis includens TaxID=689277 RepID=A0A9N8KXW6_CHRIL|nr:unnamed protein product [Chrysodeixis includens]
MNSLFSLVETLAALMFDPTYTAMYARTITVFSGAVYVFSSCMTLPAISILIWFSSPTGEKLAKRKSRLKKSKGLQHNSTSKMKNINE